VVAQIVGQLLIEPARGARLDLEQFALSWLM
jgi:hypothetical protein